MAATKFERQISNVEMIRDRDEVRMWSCECRIYVFEPQTKFERQNFECRNDQGSKLDLRTSQELARLLDEADQLVAITVASRKTARAT